METLPGFVQRSLQRAFKLRSQFYDQVEEAQDVVQDVTDFIVHSKNNKKEVRGVLQQRLDAQLAEVAGACDEVTFLWRRTQDLERELEDETADKVSYQAALAAQETELRCLRPELLQLQQQLAALSLCTADPQQPAPMILPGDTLKSAIRKVGSMIASIVPVLSNTQQQLCDEQAAHGKTRVELQQLQALLDSNKAAHSATQALLSSEQTAHATTRQQLQQAQEAGAAARADALHQLQSAVAQARDQAAERHQLAVQKIVTTHAQQIGDLQTQHALDVQRQKEQHEGGLAQLRRSLAAAEQGARDASAASAQVRADAQAQCQQLRQMRAELGSVRRERAASQTAAARVEADLLAARQEVQQVQADLQHERGQKAADLQAAAVQAQADLQAKVGPVRAGLQAERQRHTAARAAVTRLEGELQGERHRLAAAQTHAGTAAQHAAANSQLQRQLQGLTEQLAVANAREAALEADLAAKEEDIQRLQEGHSLDEEGEGNSATKKEGGSAGGGTVEVDSDRASSSAEDDGASAGITRKQHKAALRTLERMLLPARHTPTPGTLADCLADLERAIEQEGEAYDKECKEGFKGMAAEEGYTMNLKKKTLGVGGHAITFRAHKMGQTGQTVAIRFEDRQWNIMQTLRDALMAALHEVQPEATRAVETLAHAHSNSSLAVRQEGVVTVHCARLQEASLGEKLRLMTVMSVAGSLTVHQWVAQQRMQNYPDGYERFLRLCLIIVCQVAQTLASLEDRHYHGVDLKVDNVLISPGVRGCRPVLIDCFEGWFSSETEDMRRLGVPATFMCAAPEVLTFLSKFRAGSTLTDRDLKPCDLSRADVWCLGVALAEMLYPLEGWMPFGHQCSGSVQQAQWQWFKKRDGPGGKPLSDVLEQCAQRSVDSSLTGLVEEVLRSCWEQKDKRPSAHQLAAMMQKRLRL